MPDFSGRFQYLDEQGSALAQGPCQLQFDEDSCTVTPQAGAPLTFDFGDVEAASAGEWDLRLWFFDRRSVLLTHFAKAFGPMSEALLEAWRGRTVRCLLLEDLEELKRYAGYAALGEEDAACSEIRVYQSNIAVIPQVGAPIQWRLADVDSIAFDAEAYRVTLVSGGARLTLSKLAKKTDECFGALQAAHARLRERAAAALRDVFGFLRPDQLQRLVKLMPEGRSVRLAALAEIHSNLPAALVARVVDEPLRPYFETLRARAVEGSLMAGFKFIRAEEAGESDDAASEAVSAPEAGGEGKAPLFFWFFFPLAAPGGGFSNLAAWEASTGTGRATYVFRVGARGEALSGEAVERAVSRLTKALALVNFRREPVYLPDESLESQPRYRRYAIGCRRLPELRELRGAYAGRAIHATPEAWQMQMDGVLAAR
jgi:hypothetical protein